MVTRPTALESENEKSGSSQWIIDLACTKHITSYRRNFIEYWESVGQVQVVNQATIKSEGQGTVRLESIFNERKHTLCLQNVLYSPSMMYNLISAIQARRNGFRTVIDDASVNSYNGIAQMIRKKTKTVMVPGPETLESLYKALVRVKHPEKVMPSK